MSEEKIKHFKNGDRVLYQYWHSLNSRSRTLITKTGVYIRRINTKKKFAIVKFEGNKNESKVLVSELHFDAQRTNSTRE